jgi:hypothetical protein
MEDAQRPGSPIANAADARLQLSQIAAARTSQLAPSAIQGALPPGTDRAGIVDLEANDDLYQCGHCGRVFDAPDDQDDGAHCPTAG